MSGFRLTDGTSGCPPTETPPATYENPFRFDTAGRLWITSCFKGFRYLGAARHDLPIFGVLGSEWVPADPGLLAGSGIPGGTYQTLNITNSTECPLGLMLSLDMTLDLEARADNLCIWSLSSRYNGAHHSLCQASNARVSDSTALVRQIITASANPHDLGFETGATGGVGTIDVDAGTDGAAALLTLQPGASAQVGAKLFMHYAVGAATATETVYSAYSAIRVYGYILP